MPIIGTGMYRYRIIRYVCERKPVPRFQRLSDVIPFSHFSRRQDVQVLACRAHTQVRLAATAIGSKSR